MQNQSHIKHLKDFLGKEYPMYSIIAFSDRCTLKRVEVFSKNVRVVNRYNASVAISQLNQQSEQYLSNDQIIYIYNKLYPLTQVDNKTKEAHTYNVKIQNEPIYNYKTGEMKCPRCGGKLILRTAKSGMNIGKQFYGCSNYPKCKYIKNI